MNSYSEQKRKDSMQQVVYWFWLVIIVLCIGTWYCTSRWLTHKCPEPEPFKIPSIIDVQTGLVNAGYDIGPHGIDGRLADCNTVQAWYQYERDVLFNEYAAPYFTPSGAPRKKK